VNRSDFQELAELHLQHARALLDAQLYSGAYYMCGYVIECALKACICKNTSQFDFHPSPDDVRKAWSHGTKDLIASAKIKDKIDAERRADKVLDVYWTVVAVWSVDSRYIKRIQTEAEDLYAAISDPLHGVFACIKRHW
jgi:hypothetical protein